MVELTKESFSKWLTSLGSTSFAGVPGSCNACPISRYLYSLYEDYDFNTTRLTIKVVPKKDRLNYVWHSTPEWAYEFIRKVDGIKQGTITAKECLELL